MNRHTYGAGHEQARGFVCEEPETIMVLDLANAPAALLQPIRHDVRRLTDPAGIDEVIAVEEAVACAT